MSIEIKTEDDTIQIELDDTPTAKAFADQLPLHLTLKDFGGGTEKIADLPQALPIDQAPPGITPKVGYLAYYAPWGNLAIFRKNFRYSKGLVKLGELSENYSTLDGDGDVEVMIQKTSP